jgi:hypothetical protein
MRISGINTNALKFGHQCTVTPNFLWKNDSAMQYTKHCKAHVAVSFCAHLPYLCIFEVSGATRSDGGTTLTTGALPKSTAESAESAGRLLAAPCPPTYKVTSSICCTPRRLHRATYNTILGHKSSHFKVLPPSIHRETWPRCNKWRVPLSRPNNRGTLCNLCSPAVFDGS